MASVFSTEESTPLSLSYRSSNFDFLSRNDSLAKKFSNFFYDTLIPILAETNRNIPIFNSLSLFSSIFVFAQLFLGGYYIHIPNENMPKCVEIIRGIFFLYTSYFQPDAVKYTFIAINAFSFLSIILILADFHVNHRFRKPLLYFLRIWHCQIFYILIIPNSIMTLYSFRLYALNPSVENAFVCFLNTIGSIYHYVHVVFILTVLEMNPYLSKVTFHFWKLDDIYLNNLVSGFLFGLCTTFDFYSNWIRFFPQILFLAFTIFRFSTFHGLPYESNYINAFFHTQGFFMITTTILSFIRESGIYVHDLVYYLTPLLVLIISYIGLVTLLKIKTKQIIANLSDEGKEFDLDKNEKFEYFDSLKLSKIEKLYYIQVGLHYHCPLFLDWSFAQYIIANDSNDTTLLYLITWMVSFFPTESNLFHCLITIGLKIKNPPYLIRAFFYQFQRMHIFRQSAASIDSISDLKAITFQTEKCINLISSFWEAASKKQDKISFSLAHELYKHLYKADAEWAELLDKYPNNSSFTSEYSRYLLDAKSSFLDAIIWHQKSLSIDKGKLLQNDKMFRCFLKMYPEYLKKHIVDTKGNILIKKKSQHKDPRESSSSVQVSSAENTAGYATSSDSSESTINPVEASLFLPLYELRLSLERAVKATESPFVKKALIGSIIRFIFILLFLFSINFFAVSYFDTKILESLSLEHFNTFCHYTEMLTHELAWHYFLSFPEIFDLDQSSNIKTELLALYNQVLGSKALESHFLLDSNFNMEANVYFGSAATQLFLDSFTNYVYKTVSSGDSAFQGFSDIYSGLEIDGSLCIDQTENLNTTFSYANITRITIDHFMRDLVSNIMELAFDGKDVRRSWGDSVSFCRVYSEFQTMQLAFFHLIGILSDAINSQFFDLISVSPSTNFLSVYTIAPATFTPFLLLLLLLPHIIFITSYADNELIQINKNILSVDPGKASEAEEPLYRLDLNNKQLKKEKKFTSFQFKTGIINSYAIGDIILYFIIMILILCSTIFTLNLNSFIDNINNHFEIKILERNLMIDMERDSAFLIFLKQISLMSEEEQSKILNQNYFMNLDATYRRLQNDINVFDLLKTLIDNGDKEKDVTPILGFDETIDHLIQTPFCTPKASEFIIEYSNCLNLQRVVSYMSGQVRQILNTYRSINITDEIIIDLAFLTDTRLAVDFQVVLEQYPLIIEKRLNQFVSISTTFLVLEVLISALIFFIDYVSCQSFKNEYDAYRTLILRLDPIYFSSSIYLLNLINETKMDKKITSPANAVFKTSNDTMVLLSKDGIIESINRAASTVFGFRIEQLLGQNIKMILPPQDNPQFYYHLELMSKFSQSQTLESFGTGTRDDHTTIPLKILLIDCGENRKQNSFVLLLKDMSELELQKEAINIAKKQSEMILNQILPKELILPAKRGDSDICFTAEKASIVICDIDKFSIYASALPSSAILHSLNKIFLTFDKLLSNYSSMTKVKLFGDTYLAAGGLFENDMNPADHADHAIQFSLQVLESLEELNIQLNSNLQIRIGVNTDGPVHGGILGGERPWFEIVGQPIADANRLQLTANPSTIHISNETYQYVAGSSYPIFPSIMMEFKGKGKVLTYEVSLNNETSIFYGTQEPNDYESENEDDYESPIQLTQMITKNSKVNSQIDLVHSRTKLTFPNLTKIENKTALHGVAPFNIPEE